MSKSRSALLFLFLTFMLSYPNISAMEKSEEIKDKNNIKNSEQEKSTEKKSNSDNSILTQKFLEKNECYQEGLKNLNEGKEFNPQGIMIHSTATPGVMPEQWFKAWNKEGLEACVHFFLSDDLIVQCLPCNFKAWHCGGKGNSMYISIEMCEPDGIPYNENRSAILESYDVSLHQEYFKKAWKNLVWLCCCLCKTFNFDVNKIKSDKQSDEQTPAEKFNIISHKEGNQSGIASSHSDPDHWWKFFNEDTNDLRNDVNLALLSDWGVKLENLNMKKETEKS